ncbi:MAG: hypothetical protein LUQ20_06365 [Candidatus Methanoperedens sp.]|jgi:hypothetical protein|nr:hypothetical protein [Candidatus Methanoperedens sp.]
MKKMTYNETDDYFSESGTFAPKTQKKEEAYPFNVDIDYEKYERTQVKRKVLGYVSKQD